MDFGYLEVTAHVYKYNILKATDCGRYGEQRHISERANTLLTSRQQVFHRTAAMAKVYYHGIGCMGLFGGIFLLSIFLRDFFLCPDH